MRIKFTSEYKLPIATAKGGDIRTFTAGEVIDVDAGHAAVFLSSGAAVVVADEPKAAEADQATKPLGRMNLAELNAVLEAEGIDKGEASTKAEIVAVIEAARAAE